MKSYNHLWEQFISDDNIKLAIKNVCKHKGNRKQFKELKENPEANIEWIRSYALNFKNANHKPIEIYDGIQRKKRTIIVPTFEEQIIHHMVVNVLKPIIMRPMYEHSYGSIPNRGATLGRKYIEKWIKHDHKNTRYCLKMDIRKYFDSIPHDVIIKRLTEQIHDKQFLDVLTEIISVTNVGIPLGFYTSQWLANWYLTALDHYIKEDLCAKYYIRYMDDMVVFGSNKRKLHRMRESIAQFLNLIGLEMKSNWQVFPIISRFLDFMGYRFYHNRVTLRRSILYKACRKSNRLAKHKPSIYSLKQAMSYLGWFSQSDTYNIFRKRFNNNINIQYMKRRISTYDKRMAICTG